jgi:hypothetical protein
MIIEIVIVCLVSIPGIIYAFRKIKKAKMGCCSCEQVVDVEENKNESQQENITEKLSLMQILVQKFTPRKNVAVLPSQNTNVSDISV